MDKMRTVTPLPTGKAFPSLIRRSWILALLLIPLCGCVAPNVVVKPEANLKTFRKIYVSVPESESDPRHVHPRIVSRLRRTGFTVVEIDANGPAVDAQGTGFVITPEGHILTCAHVVGSQTNATIWLDGTRYVCTVQFADTNVDLAVLQVNGEHPPFQPLRFVANTNYGMGQEVYTMGFPLADMLGSAPRLNKGMISSTVGMEDSPTQLQVSAPVQPGNSGGPLFNEHAEVVGVVVATLNPLKVLVQSGGSLPQNVNFATKTGPVLDFLKKAKVQLRVETNDGPKDFEAARSSLALVRSGNVSDDDLKQPALFCSCTYLSFWDMFYRFRAIELDFHDVKKGERVFRVGQYRDDLFSSEDNTLDRLFGEISNSFFPDQPNPFKKSNPQHPTSSGK